MDLESSGKPRSFSPARASPFSWAVARAILAALLWHGLPIALYFICEAFKKLQHSFFNSLSRLPPAPADRAAACTALAWECRQKSPRQTFEDLCALTVLAQLLRAFSLAREGRRHRHCQRLRVVEHLVLVRQGTSCGVLPRGCDDDEGSKTELPCM